LHDIKIQKEKSTEKSFEKQKKKKRMEYKQYNLKELQNMFDKQQNPEELDKNHRHNS